MNTSKARGDQSGYLWDAENVYANWHGRQPPVLIGERNRMPLYAGYLALFYRPDMSDPEFFEVAKRANIGLSVCLLVLLALIFARHLPAASAINLTGIVAFGMFVFKAGYSQSELLFYFLEFLTFLGCWHLLGPLRGRRAAGVAALTGAAAGLAHLTKAAMLPLVAIVLALSAMRLVGSAAGFRRREKEGRAAVAAVLFAAAFMAVVWPYVSTSKRVFGQYFYNVNSTFYVWYDDWAHASLGTYAHGDGVGWPAMPASELPGLARYWREHSLARIGTRMAGGFKDMALTSYRTFGYLPYLVAFSAMLAVVLITRRARIAQLAGERPWLVAFLAAYGGVYLVAIAFYYPTSGTGTGRFLLAHMTPLFFALACLFSDVQLRQAPWRAAGISLRLEHFDWFVMGMLALDVTFRLWPRLMTTYGGF